MISLGIDIGYSAVKVAAVDENKEVVWSRYVLHRGEAAAKLRQILEELPPEMKSGVLYGAVTGSIGKGMADEKGVRSVNDIAAVVEGALLLVPECCAVAEIGGQRAGYITGFSKDRETRLEFSLNPDCSAGTGSFLEEQSSRIGIEIEDFSRIECGANSTPRIAGRCSVFAKTDITHHQQEGVSIPDILRGLAYATARNYRNAVMRGLPLNCPIFIAGGVARNRAVVSSLRKVLRLGENQLLTHEKSERAGAIGAAVIALKERLELDYGKLVSQRIVPFAAIGLEKATLAPLAGLGSGDAAGKHFCAPVPEVEEPIECWLGVDVGSTSTNVVLVDARNRVLGYRYLRTAGNPVKAVRVGLKELGEEFGNRVRVKGAATTGSGRNMTGKFIGADVVRDEITAQARAAVSLYPDVDTVYEIGGQDSKFISFKHGAVSDFQMNKVCAAGTGSFIEEQAKKIGIALDDYADIAFKSEQPVNLGERCTVFMETSISACLAQGEPVENIAAGLCYSIIKNYINRVVGRKKSGDMILLQGGVAYNQAVVNAFRSVTGKEIIVPPFFSVTGALGAAILAREEMDSAETGFKGFELDGAVAVHSNRNEQESAGLLAPGSFNRQVQDFIFRDYDPDLNPAKKTVGMPRTLFTFGMFPLFHTFFKELGVNVLLSEPTSGETIRLAQEYSLDETCYPIKLINGHAAELVEQNVDYLFFPDLFTAFHPNSKSRQTYGCPYMQLAFKIINEAMKLSEKEIILLSPTIAFSQGQDFMQNQFVELGRQLGRTAEESLAAIKAGMQNYQQLQKRMEERGRRTLNSLDPNEKGFVIISKIYGVADPVLNMGIPDKLAEMGYKTIPLYDLPETDIFDDYPNMFWPFGQHMMAAAKLVSRHPNLYPIFLTHHGCGPDTVFSHYFGEIMKDKPSLTIEVDEHSSSVGVQTRVEAFVNSLRQLPVLESLPIEDLVDKRFSSPVNISTDCTGFDSATVLLPNLYPYSEIACAMFKGAGVDAAVLGPTCAESIDLGRRFSCGNEYFSLTALLGDVLYSLKNCSNSQSPCVLIPQNEGAEVDGQYSRFLRCVLDHQDQEGVKLISPYLEEMRNLDFRSAQLLFLCLLAGDLVLLSPENLRGEHLKFVKEQVDADELSFEKLELLAARISEQLSRAAKAETGNTGTVMGIGEPLVLFNSALNDNIFNRLEEKGQRVIYAPLSEYLWNHWYDYYNYNKTEAHSSMRSNIAVFKEYLERISAKLGVHSHYEREFGTLKKIADRGLGYYAGGFGRYRGAKIMEEVSGVKGVISVTSMYENTGISLGILKDRLDDKPYAPILSLTFDGNRNENNRLKVDSFIYNL
ncbi:acyl-CoA dehydratase activase [Maridesulfovibrio sp.]|uniref:acyl-CoA dehydratase activase n=1 Tax=Maridesulfovibrio sp. TaxID=2795000 RepID=UPI002AA92D20|nr:acyl-CoA dehydratase activase [Maridesulfovibrio sp.]